MFPSHNADSYPHLRSCHCNIESLCEISFSVSLSPFSSLPPPLSPLPDSLLQIPNLDVSILSWDQLKLGPPQLSPLPSASALHFSLLFSLGTFLYSDLSSCVIYLGEALPGHTICSNSRLTNDTLPGAMSRNGKRHLTSGDQPPEMQGIDG